MDIGNFNGNYNWPLNFIFNYLINTLSVDRSGKTTGTWVSQSAEYHLMQRLIG